MTGQEFFSRPAKRRLRDLSADLADQRLGFRIHAYEGLVALGVFVSLLANI